MSERVVSNPAQVTVGLYTLLEGLIDYAGLFPPAGLPLATALAHYARHLTTSERWMLGRFILPAGQLAALDDGLMASFTPDQPLTLSLLCQAWATDPAAAQAAEARWGGRLRIEVLETCLPPTDAPTGYIQAAGATFEEFGFAGRPIFFELPFDADWEARLEPTVAALAAYRATSGAPVGFKLRCGGLTPESVPTLQQVAQALLACRDHAVPLKATAGLHHPFRHTDPDLGAPGHGFINLFGAGALAHVCALQLAETTTILAATEPASFQFSAVGLRWGAWTVDIDRLRAVRQTALPAFGSCSFDEPRDDLRALGWL